jgi:FlaA1/EpsC-like NDP-sugar epimerase
MMRQLESRVAGRTAASVALHVALWSAAWLTAFLLRFDLKIPELYQTTLYVGWVLPLVAVRLVVYAWSGGFRVMWRYFGIRDLRALVQSTLAGTVVLVLALSLSGVRGFPRSIPIIEAMVALGYVISARLTLRTVLQLSDRSGVEASAASARKRVLIVGAGDAGARLLSELLDNLRGRYDAVGFLDDDPAKLGQYIHGVKVVGSLAEARELIGLYAIHEVVVAIPSASGREMRRIVDACGGGSVPVRTVPRLEDLMQGRARFSELRDVAIEDLLGRPPVTLDAGQVSDLIHHRVALVTGAGGSIGSELCRQICRFRPTQLVLVEQAENSLYDIHRELAAAWPQVVLVPVIADVCDRTRMLEVVRRHRPEIILHAAAHKHVPMMEWNPGEAVKNNVLGSRTVADVADEAGVANFVMISTDKAVNPTSVMGATKRLAELYMLAKSRTSSTRYVTVRFGNVLGSRGSVVPLFKEQIARGGPITVTHADMVRYFMTIPEASQLVLQAAAMGHTGEVFVLDMGEPVRIMSLARDLITLSGLRPDEDIEIHVTGMRPGEKLFEELTISAENATTTRHPRIFVGRSEDVPGLETLTRQLDGLLAGIDQAEPSEVRRRIAGLVPTYALPSEDAAPVVIPFGRRGPA